MPAPADSATCFPVVYHEPILVTNWVHRRRSAISHRSLHSEESMAKQRKESMEEQKNERMAKQRNEQGGLKERRHLPGVWDKWGFHSFVSCLIISI